MEKNLINAFKQAVCFMDDKAFTVIYDDCNLPQEVRTALLQYRNDCQKYGNEILKKYTTELNDYPSLMRMHDKVMAYKTVKLADIETFIERLKEIIEETEYLVLKQKYQETLKYTEYTFGKLKENYEETFGTAE